MHTLSEESIKLGLEIDVTETKKLAFSGNMQAHVCANGTTL